MAIKTKCTIAREFTPAEIESINGRRRHLPIEEQQALQALESEYWQAQRERENVSYAQRWLIDNFGDRIAPIAIAPQDTQAIEKIEIWAKSKAWAMILVGGVGCGKTIAAAHYAYASIVNGWGIPRVVNAAQLPFAPVFGSEGAVFVNKLCANEVLIIDDLGCEVVAAPIVATISAVVDERYRRNRATLITTNLTPTAFAERYGQRVVDRLLDNGIIEQLSEKSMRGEK